MQPYTQFSCPAADHRGHCCELSWHAQVGRGHQRAAQAARWRGGAILNPFSRFSSLYGTSTVGIPSPYSGSSYSVLEACNRCNTGTRVPGRSTK